MTSKSAVFLVIAAQVCATLALPPCACTRNLRPVCGSDGHTYSNQCILDCEKSRNNRELSAVRDGPCEETALPSVKDNCICTLDYRPVCGSDGTTYPNRCSLTCQRSYVPDLEVKYDGRCSNEAVKIVDPETEKVKVVELPPCTCTREAKPVCGSDGNTYSNDCMLNCATAHNSMLSIKHYGACEGKADIPAQSACTCTRNYEPVCGSNGLTYGNTCLLNCAGVQLVKHTPCDGAEN